MHVKNRFGKDGQFIPKFGEKYIGKYPIQMRSTWERKFANWLDKNPAVVEWSSESIAIPYWNPVLKKNKRYYPDFYFKIKKPSGGIAEYIVEIKPHKETVRPRNSVKSRKRRLYEEKTYMVNMAKWKAAEVFCKKIGFEFKKLTEKELFG